MKRHFAEFSLPVDGKTISLIPGLFGETIPAQTEMVIAFAHIDCDWYDPVTSCLEYVTPRLSTGGFIVMDDYNDWPGCKRATDEFCAAHPELKPTRHRPNFILCKVT